MQCIQSQSEMNGHGLDFGHKFLDTDTIFFWISDTDMGRVMTSDTGSDTHMSENLGHGHTSDTRVRSSLIRSVTFQAHSIHVQFALTTLKTLIQHESYWIRNVYQECFMHYQNVLSAFFLFGLKMTFYNRSSIGIFGLQSVINRLIFKSGCLSLSNMN